MKTHPWRVDVIVRGVRAGAYTFKTKKAAEKNARERTKRFGALGIRYKVEGGP